MGLLPAQLAQSGLGAGARIRWLAYLLAGAGSPPPSVRCLVLVLLACGLVEVGIRRGSAGGPSGSLGLSPLLLGLAAPVLGGLAALAWVALKVGALSYGGGFVIVPLMQHDAVSNYHWMSSSQFLSAVALGQITPGPVVQTVAVVGYAAAGLGGGLLAATIAFAPSFAFVIGGAPHLDRLRRSLGAQAFLTGAGAAAIGAIAGSAIPLALSLSELWQLGLLAAAALWLFAFRRGVVSALIGSGALGVALVLLGAPFPR